MLSIFLSLLAIFLLLVGTEWLFKKHRIHGEIGRKIVHILTGTFVAFWPFYMSFRSIQLISVLFLIVVLLSQKLEVFESIRAIKRKTWGEVLFAVGIGFTALITDSPQIFAVAILHLAIGDGLAALVGSNYGKKTFRVNGEKLHYTGVAAFAAVSMLIMIGYLLFATNDPLLAAPLVLGLIPLNATIIETISIRGTDNITVPLFVVIILNSLNFVS